MAIIYDQSGYIYDTNHIYDTLLYDISIRANIKGLKTIEIKSRIHPTLAIRAKIWPKKQISIKSRIIPTLSIKAKIYKIIKYDFSAQTRIQRRQGWPVAELEDPGYLLWQDTRIYNRANIYSYLALPTQTTKLRANITYNKTYDINIKAKLVLAATLQIKANILPRFFTINLPTYFSVQRTVVENATIQFVIPGDYRTSTVSARAEINKTSENRIVGHFIIPLNPTVINNIMIIPNLIVLGRTQQSVLMRSRIT